MRTHPGPVLALTLALILPLSAQMTMTGTAAEGRRLFYSPTLSTNGLSCNHCHADFDEKLKDDGLIRAGHPLANAAQRETWWGKDPKRPNAYRQIAAAAVVCVEHYLRNPTKLTAQQMLDLQAYLEAITRRPDRAPLAIAPAADQSGEYRGFEDGNRLDGKPLFDAACHVCHPNGNAGIAPAIPRDREPPFYARKVREGDGLGAVLSGIDPDAYDPAAARFMPFFGADRLSRGQLRDLIAYVKSLPPLPAAEPAKKTARRGKAASSPSKPPRP
jgi:mono/diheme cytochrome c family protein